MEHTDKVPGTQESHRRNIEKGFLVTKAKRNYCLVIKNHPNAVPQRFINTFFTF